ncbi:uncharacterized protein DUF2752 [Asanoa ferruginea]|uniref:Uncharacterized protein DUF2752 n=1 Tax=Asanoa ferruginea TaxID=53367 RepID=A0A3D9ZKY1_9ACTN|nr:DUF2752 domain-containing protein [Asanoa ferruginea]REF97925.1 uncharacterized protein DUF2752 [Asanoa ferruginea]GIF50049.1 hypothetical protein Afe04nite_45880 [Asanoa ferruginea]
MTPAPNPASTQAFAGAEDSTTPGGDGGAPTFAGPAPETGAGVPGYGAVEAQPSEGTPAGAVALAAVPPAFLPPSYAPPRRGRVGRAYLRMLERVPGWLAPLAVLGCIGGAVGYTLITNPTDSAADAPPTCILKLTTGLDCPGCGGTRAAWYLLHGDVAAAARHHLLFVFAVPFVLYLYVAWAAQRAFGWKIPQLRIPPIAIALFMGAWLAFSVLRNLPWAPFNWFYV